MTIVVGIDEIRGLDDVRARMGDSSQLNRRLADVLNQAARIGAQSARIYAPKRSSQLTNHITDDAVQFTMGQNVIEARFGVQPVLPRGAGGRFTTGARNYPLWVHEGTGIYGHFRRAITPRRAKAMVFVGRTGLVKTKSVRGQRPQPYMARAYDDARTYIDAHLDDFVNHLFD
jgi:hypothetical protein